MEMDFSLKQVINDQPKLSPNNTHKQIIMRTSQNSPHPALLNNKKNIYSVKNKNNQSKKSSNGKSADRLGRSPTVKTNESSKNTAKTQKERVYNRVKQQVTLCDGRVIEA